jgi:hypothetical protein
MMSHSKAMDAMSIEPKKSSPKIATLPATIPLGKRYIQMQQLAAEEILPILEASYDFINAIRVACETDGELDPEPFIKQGMKTLKEALDLDEGVRIMAETAEEEEEEEEEEEDEDEEEEEEE